MEFDFEIEKAVKEIKKQKAKLVCIQLPDGFKKEATNIAEKLEKKTNATILIWLDSCYGSCDIPLGLEKLNIDLLIQFGHSNWKKITLIGRKGG